MARFRLKILIGFVLTLLIFSVLSIYTYYNNRVQQQTTEWVTHTIEVLYSSQLLLNDLLDAETGQRGYIITGDSSYLRPYQKALQSIRDDIKTLKALTADNILQQENVSDIIPIIEQRMQILSAVSTARKNSFEAAKELMIAKGGPQRTQEIRIAIEKVQQIENQLLVERKKLSKARTIVFDVTYLITGAIMVLVMVGLFYIIYTNVGERERIQTELQKSTDELEDLYNNAPCGYFSVNANSEITNLNSTLAHWLGYDKSEIISNISYPNILAAETRSAFATSADNDYAKFKDQGVAIDLEFDFRRKNGSSLPVIVNSTALYDTDGNFLHSRSSVFDNTERKKAEAERDNFFNNSSDLLTILSPDLNFLRWNSTWHTALGYPDVELRNKNVMSFIHPDDAENAFTFLRNEVSTGRMVSLFESRFRSKNGRYRWLQWSAVPLLDRGIVYGFARDVTEQKLATERAFQLNSELEAFTYSVSHDLRAPLRSITGFAQMLKEDYHDKLDTEGMRLTDVIIKSSGRMGQLIDDLLDFSRIGRKELSISQLNMRDLVDDIVEEQKVSEYGRSVDVTVHPLKPSKADVAMVRVIWNNLISNAFKYSRRKASTSIEIGSYELDDKICYYVADQGAGFDMRYANKLFGVFQRLHKANEFEGTGVGLALVKRIVDRHGGRIWAESKLNEGSKFYFTLPRQ